MQEIKKVYDIRVDQYRKKFGDNYLSTRAGMEELIASIGDAMSAVQNGGIIGETTTVDGKEITKYSFLPGVLTSEGRQSLQIIADKLQSILYGETNTEVKVDPINIINFFSIKKIRRSNSI